MLATDFVGWSLEALVLYQVLEKGAPFNPSGFFKKEEELEHPHHPHH